MLLLSQRVRPEAGQPHRASAMGTPGRPDDRFRETHHLQPCYPRAVMNYRRNFICGGSFFVTANLAERRLRLLADDIVSAKDDGFRFRLRAPRYGGLEPSVARGASEGGPLNTSYELAQQM